MFESRSSSSSRKRFLYLRVIIDYLKTNGHRIAHHVLSRTPTPLASRDDIKPLLTLVDGEIADILTLDSQNRKTFIKSVEFEELIAHFSGDMALNESLKGIQNKNMDNIHYIFITNGIFSPSFLQEQYLNQYPFLSEINFFETRFEAESIHKIGNPSIYMRKVVGQIRKMNTIFTEIPEDVCNCDGHYWKGTYAISYWEKTKTLEYYICGNCSIQKEQPDNADSIMTFVQGLSAE
jgi:hypothetical protein